MIKKGFSIIEISVFAAIVLLICIMLISTTLNSAALINKGNEKINTSIFSSSVIEYYMGEGVDNLFLYNETEENAANYFLFNDFEELQYILNNKINFSIALVDNFDELKREGLEKNKRYAGVIKLEKDTSFKFCLLYKITCEIFNIRIGKPSISRITSFIRG